MRISLLICWLMRARRCCSLLRWVWAKGSHPCRENKEIGVKRSDELMNYSSKSNYFKHRGSEVCCHIRCPEVRHPKRHMSHAGLHSPPTQTTSELFFNTVHHLMGKLSFCCLMLYICLHVPANILYINRDKWQWTFRDYFAQRRAFLVDFTWP